MKVEVYGKNGFTPSSANKEYCEAKLEKLNNYFSKEIELEAKVVCKVYKESHKVEITIPTKNLMMRAEVNDIDLYSAIDKAVDKLLVQVRKHKDKVKNKFEKEGIKTVFKTEFDSEINEKQKKQDVVRKKNIDLVPMSVDDAINQMELLGHNFFIYLDEITFKVNVIYVREDSGYAIIETK